MTQYDNANVTWQLENAYAYTNLGILHYKAGEAESAITAFENSLPGYEANAEAKPMDVWARLDWANIYGWMADAYMLYSPLDQARSLREKQLGLLVDIEIAFPNDARVKTEKAAVYIALAQIAFWRGDWDQTDALIRMHLDEITALRSLDHSDLALTQDEARNHVLALNLLFAKGDYSVMPLRIDFLKDNIDQLKQKSDLSDGQKTSIHAPYQIFKAMNLHKNRQTTEAIGVLENLYEEFSKLEGISLHRRNEILTRSCLLLGDIFKESGDALSARKWWITAETISPSFNLPTNVLIPRKKIQQRLGGVKMNNDLDNELNSRQISKTLY